MEVASQARANPLRWAFGHPLPPEELERWLMASPDQRAGAAARLEAIRNWPAPGTRGVDYLRAELAATAGMTPKRMRNLVAEWRSSEPSRRSLAMLGLRVDPRRSPKLAKTAGARELVRTVVREIEDFDVGTVESVVRRMRLDPRLIESPVGINMLREAVRDLRIERSGGRSFGRHLVVDEVPLAVCAPSGIAYRAVIVLDETTRLAFGAAVEAGPPTIATVRDAARDSADRLRRVGFPGVAAADGNVSVTVALSDPNFPAVLRFFAEQPGWSEQKGIRGRLAAHVLGGAIGRVGVRPALDYDRNLSECDDSIPRVSSGEAKALLDLAIDRHNAGLIGSGTEDEAVTTRRNVIAGVMEDAALVM